MDIVGTALDIAFVLVMLGVAFSLVRLVLGPSLPDRIVALDLMTILIVSFCGLYSILAEEQDFLDVAIVLALIGFLATVALARYVERRHANEEAAQPKDKEGAQP